MKVLDWVFLNIIMLQLSKESYEYQQVEKLVPLSFRITYGNVFFTYFYLLIYCKNTLFN